MPVSLAAKPEPTIWTEVPAGALPRLIVMYGVTVNGRETGAVAGPEAFIEWAPEAEAGTTKALFQFPDPSA